MSDPPQPAGRRFGAIALLALAISGCLMYAPWIARPFDVVDFAEFLPFLRTDGSAWDRFSAFVGYYGGQHGRLNLVSYAAIVLKWEVLGDHPMAWHWLRLVQSSLIVVLVYQVARRLDATRFAAGAAAALFLVGRPAAEGWFRLTLGEPLGLLLMLGAMLLATGWRQDPTPRRGIAIALLVTGAILAKEMLAGIAPWVFVVGALRNDEGRIDPATPADGRRALALWVAIPALLTFGAAAMTARSAAGTGFNTQYGAGTFSIGDLLTLFARPWQVVSGATGGPWVLRPANALLLILIIGGLAAVRRADPAARRHLMWLLKGALGTSLAFALLYLPWPWAYAYYAMPFMLGPALLLAGALSALERLTPEHSKYHGAAIMVMLLTAAQPSAREGRRAIALQRVNGRVVQALAERATADSFFVLRPQIGRDGSLGAAPILQHYALAAGLAPAMPAAADRPCNALGDLVGDHGGRVLIVTYLGGCGVFTNPPTVLIRDTVHYLEGFGRPREETLGADIIDVARQMPAPIR